MANLENIGDQAGFFFCDLAALEPGQLKEITEISKELFSSVRATQELTNGYALELPVSTDSLVKAGKFIALERLCCPWHGSSLELEADANTFRLSLTGPEGAKAVLGMALANFIPSLTEEKVKI